jgi:hypothetical protein
MYSALQPIMEKRTRPILNWQAALNRLAILFEEPLAPFLIHTLYIEDLTHLTRVDQVSQHVSSS